MDCLVILRRIKGLLYHIKKNQGTVLSYLEESRDYSIMSRRVKGLFYHIKKNQGTILSY